LDNSAAAQTADAATSAANAALQARVIDYATFPGLITTLKHSHEGIVSSYKAWWKSRLAQLEDQIRQSQCQGINQSEISSLRAEIDGITSPETFINEAVSLELKVKQLEAAVAGQISEKVDDIKQRYQPMIAKLAESGQISMLVGKLENCNTRQIDDLLLRLSVHRTNIAFYVLFILFSLMNTKRS
jgi:hypothetical protein